MRSKPYPQELRSEAVRLVVEMRLTAGQTASKLGVRTEAVSVWVRRYRASRSRLDEMHRMKILLQNMARERDALANIALSLMGKLD
jgi:transposase-like protein